MSPALPYLRGFFEKKLLLISTLYVKDSSFERALRVKESQNSHILDSISLGKIVQIRERLLQAQARGQKVFRFESGDPNFSLAPHLEKAVAQAAAEGKTHYIPNNGIPELRKALAVKVKEKNGIPASDSNIFLTNGAMHALFVTFSCLLEKGDEVIVPDPMWTEVVENIRLAGGVPVGVPLKSSEAFEYSPTEIEKRITPRTKVLFINTPHNPTGAVLAKEKLGALVNLAKKHNLWIVSDEAYEDVIFDDRVHVSTASLATDYKEKVISIFSFSKSHAMSGLRTGYIVTFSPTLMDRIPKLLRCTINGVNSLSQWTALAAVTGPQKHLSDMKAEYEVRRDLMTQALQDIPGLHVFKARGTFFLWAEIDPSLYTRLKIKNADELSNLLAEKGIGSSPGDAFGESCHNAIRFAFSCSTEMVKEGVPELRKVLLG